MSPTAHADLGLACFSNSVTLARHTGLRESEWCTKRAVAFSPPSGGRQFDHQRPFVLNFFDYLKRRSP